jgi:hypothetical protein
MIIASFSRFQAEHYCRHLAGHDEIASQLPKLSPP